ncbi:MAG: hypothetical protein FJZ47_24145, partial [Candidatus Tectomicrobia bacterium]|nr:hypothetical protein [Candidatus Tectomicrobia bacterium]
MKCLKCNYVSHDYLDACRKCGIDLRDFKREIGLFVLQPGVLDLSMVLGGAGADDLFANVGDEVIMHARDDDDFDISLDDYTEQPGGRRTAFGMVRGAGRRSEDDVAGMEHLTLELDASDLPAEVTARLRAAQVIPDVPFPTAEPPTVPEALTLPGHVTVEMDAAGLSGELPPDIFQGRIPGAT